MSASQRWMYCAAILSSVIIVDWVASLIGLCFLNLPLMLIALFTSVGIVVTAGRGAMAAVWSYLADPMDRDGPPGGDQWHDGPRRDQVHW